MDGDGEGELWNSDQSGEVWIPSDQSGSRSAFESMLRNDLFISDQSRLSFEGTFKSSWHMAFKCYKATATCNNLEIFISSRAKQNKDKHKKGNGTCISSRQNKKRENSRYMINVTTTADIFGVIFSVKLFLLMPNWRFFVRVSTMTL